MAMRFEDILSAVCSQVVLQHADYIQIMYLVGNRSEADLALDALVTNDFEAMLYHDNNGAELSKLYIKRPSFSPEVTEQKMENTLVYIESLKQIKKALDNLCGRQLSPFSTHHYGMIFTNTDNGGKQILIQIAPPLPDPSQGFLAPEMLSPNRRPFKKRNAARKSAGSDFFAKPAVMRDVSQDNVVKQIWTPVIGRLNIIWITIIAVIIVASGAANMAYLLAMAVLCPDIATDRSRVPAYCESTTKIDDARKRPTDVVREELYKKEEEGQKK